MSDRAEIHTNSLCFNGCPQSSWGVCWGGQCWVSLTSRKNQALSHVPHRSPLESPWRVASIYIPPWAPAGPRAKARPIVLLSHWCKIAGNGGWGRAAQERGWQREMGGLARAPARGALHRPPCRPSLGQPLTHMGKMGSQEVQPEPTTGALEQSRSHVSRAVMDAWGGRDLRSNLGCASLAPGLGQIPSGEPPFLPWKWGDHV